MNGIRFSLWPTIIGLIALGLVAACSREGEGAGDGAGDKRGQLKIGDTAPMIDVEMKNVDDRSLSIKDVAGEKGTLVVFSCNACPWAKAWEERIAAVGKEYPAKGVGVIIINANDPERVTEDAFSVMKTRAEKLGLRAPYVVDATSDVARAFGATRTPEVYLFNGDWKLVYHGAVDDNAKEPEKVETRYLRDAIDALIVGMEIAVKETKALGCSIKFREAKATKS